LLFSFPFFFRCLLQAREIHVITVATKNGLTPARTSFPETKGTKETTKEMGVGESAMKRPKMALFTPSFLL
jgi:hypothetical protein